MEPNATLEVTLQPPKPPAWALTTAQSAAPNYNFVGYPSEGIIHVKGQPGPQTLRLQVLGIAPMTAANISVALRVQYGGVDPAAVLMPNGPLHQAYLWPFSTPPNGLCPWCVSPTSLPASLTWQPVDPAPTNPSIDLSFNAGRESWLCQFRFAVTYKIDTSEVVGIAVFDPKIYNEGVPPI